MSTTATPRRALPGYAGLAAGEFAAKLIGFAAFAWLARALEPRAYGTLELAVSVGMVTLLVIDFGLGPVASRILTRDPDRADSLTGTVPAIRTALAGLGLLCALTLGAAVTPSATGHQLIVLYVMALLFTPWTLDWLFQGLGRTGWVAPAQLLRMTVFFLGVTLFVEGPEHILRVGGAEIAALGALAGYYVFAARSVGQRPRIRPDRATARSLLREAAPVGGGQWVWILTQYLPIFALSAWSGADAVGYFGAAHRVVFGLGSFIFLYFFALYPSLVIATHDQPGDFEPVLSVSISGTAWVGGFTAVVGTLLAHPVSRLAFGPEFGPTAALLALLVWSLPLQLISGHARFTLIAAGHPGAHLWTQAAGFAAGLVACAVLVPRFEGTGAAAALLLSTLVVWLSAEQAVRRQVAAMPGLAALWRPGLATACSLGLALAIPRHHMGLRLFAAVGVFAILAWWLDRPRLAAWIAQLRGQPQATA